LEHYVHEENASNPANKWGELHPIANDNTIILEIYSDEIKRVRLESDNSVWMYLGALFVPMEVKEYYLSLLNNCRCIKNNDWHQQEDQCPHRCEVIHEVE